MDEIYQKIQQSKDNNVQKLTEWLKEAKLVDLAKLNEAQIKSMFQNVQDKNNITLEQFKEVVTQVSQKTGKPMDDAVTKLKEAAQAVFTLISSGTEALKGTLAK